MNRNAGTLWYARYLRWIPALWMLGALAPLGAVLLFRLVWSRWPRGPLVNLVVWSWISIGLAQGLSAMVNGIAEGDAGKGLAHLAGFGVVGWIFGGLAIAVGASYRLDDARAVRATSQLGLYVLLLSGCVVVAIAMGYSTLFFQTPVSMVLPESKAVDMYATARMFHTEETFGEGKTRLILFFPYATGLGLAGLCITFVSFLNDRPMYRWIGVAGGLVAVVFSWSRIALASLALAAMLYVFLKLPPFLKAVSIGLLFVVIYSAALTGVDFALMFDDLRSGVDSARAGSSIARDLIYQRSWDGFLEAPYLGHGWIGPSVHPTEDLPIGSHSTWYGLLYTGGVTTLAAFILAMASTSLGVARSFLRSPVGSRARAAAVVALLLVMCLAAYSRFESLFSLTLPCVFLFTFIGASLVADEGATI